MLNIEKKQTKKQTCKCRLGCHVRQVDRISTIEFRNRQQKHEGMVTEWNNIIR